MLTKKFWLVVKTMFLGEVETAVRLGIGTGLVTWAKWCHFEPVTFFLTGRGGGRMGNLLKRIHLKLCLGSDSTRIKREKEKKKTPHSTYSSHRCINGFLLWKYFLKWCFKFSANIFFSLFSVLCWKTIKIFYYTFSRMVVPKIVSLEGNFALQK